MLRLAPLALAGLAAGALLLLLLLVFLALAGLAAGALLLFFLAGLLALGLAAGALLLVLLAASSTPACPCPPAGAPGRAAAALLLVLLLLVFLFLAFLGLAVGVRVFVLLSGCGRRLAEESRGVVLAVVRIGCDLLTHHGGQGAEHLLLVLGVVAPGAHLLVVRRALGELLGPPGRVLHANQQGQQVHAQEIADWRPLSP